MQTKLDLDPERDPLAHPQATLRIDQWAACLQMIQPQSPVEVSAEEQRAQVTRIVSLLQPSNRGEISAEDHTKAQELLLNLPRILRNPEEFVSGSFLRHYPGWEELIRKVEPKVLPPGAPLV